MGLYDDDKADVTGGDILDVTYWQTRYAALKLDAALRTRQPEAAIKGLIPPVTNGCNDLLATYPNHDEIKQWKAKAADIESKIDPYAAPAPFKGNFAHWNDFAYESAWRFYHLARMAAADDDWTMTKSYASDATINFERVLQRMGQWDQEAQEWVGKAHADLAGLSAVAAGKL